MSSLKEFAKKAQDKEKERIGDVYDECEKRGCERRFLVQFNTRIEMYPVEQTKAFFKMSEIQLDKIKQWKIYLQVLIEKRFDSPMVKNWKTALEILNINTYPKGKEE